MQNVVFLTRQCENAVNNYDQVLIYGYEIQKLTFWAYDLFHKPKCKNDTLTICLEKQQCFSADVVCL